MVKNFTPQLFNFRAALQASHVFSESMRFINHDEPFILSELAENKYIIQLDSGIAEAEKETIFSYTTDTIKAATEEMFKSIIARKIRENADTSMIENLDYSISFLTNLFGEKANELKISEIVTAENDLETLIKNTEEAIKKSTETIFKDTASNYKVLKMIRKYDSTRAWVTRQHLNYLVQDTAIFNNYMALLYEQVRGEDIMTVSKSLLDDELTVMEDLQPIRKSALNKGSILKKDSDLNGKTKVTEPEKKLTNSVVIFNESLIKKNSKLSKGSVLYQKKTFIQLMKEHKKDIFLFRDYLNEFIELTEEVDRVFKEIQGKREAEEEITSEELYTYVNTAIDALEYAADVSYFFQDDEKFDPFLKIARNGNDMYLNIISQEYIAAVNNLVSILDEVSEELKGETSKFKDAKNEINDKIKSAKTTKKNIKKGIFGVKKADADIRFTINSHRNRLKALKSERNNLRVRQRANRFTKTTSRILKYGTFMSNIVQSDSVEEIKAAIQAAALPVGSYTIKRENRWDVSVNTYLGASYSNEFITSGDFSSLQTAASNNVVGGEGPTISRRNGSFGVWAPIGIAGSYGIGRKRSWGSVSIFLTLLDLGAIVDFRLQNPDSANVEIMSATDTLSVNRAISVEELPEINLENLFAPGAYLVYGIPKLPISVGGGLQKGPQLRQIDISDNGEVVTTVNASAYRWNFFVALDIPLVTLFSRSR